MTTRTKQSLVGTFQKLKINQYHFGLNFNEQKIKYLRCSNKKKFLNDIDINSKDLEQVKLYKFLGSVVNGDNSTEVDTKEITAIDN
jgi:hypothetical protein